MVKMTTDIEGDGLSYEPLQSIELARPGSRYTNMLLLAHLGLDSQPTSKLSHHHGSAALKSACRRVPSGPPAPPCWGNSGRATSGGFSNCCMRCSTGAESEPRRAPSRLGVSRSADGGTGRQ